MEIILSVSYEKLNLEIKIATFLEKKGHVVTKLTNRSKIPNYVNEGLYPSESIAQDDADLAIIISEKPCGVVMAANKVKGVRCLSVLNIEMAEKMKKEFNPNVIVIPARKEEEIISFIDKFLNTTYNKKKYNHEITTLHDYEFSCSDC